MGAGRAGPGAAGRGTRARGPSTSSARSPSSRPRTARRCWSPFSLDGAKAEELLAEEEGVTESFVTALRESLESELGATATSAGDLGLQAWVTGPAGFVADLVTAFGGIDGVLLLVALGAVLLILASSTGRRSCRSS